MNIKKEIINQLSKMSGKKVNEKDQISSLGIDSLDLMELVMEAETKIGVELSDDIISSLKDKTVRNIIDEFEKISQ